MIQLVPMTQAEFEKFLSIEIEAYAQEHVKSGNWTPEEAVRLSKEEHDKLLPAGLASPDQYLYSIQDTQSGSNVGMIWIASQQRGTQRTAFIYNIEIAEAQRGKGYGRQALLAVEEKVKALGLDTISLHVFGHNLVARTLYENVGYEVTNVLMSKKLTHDTP